MNRIIILFATALFSIALASPTISPERNNLKLLETAPMLYYNNLALNQFSLPFNSMSLDLQVGPLTVISVYGDLRVYKGNVNEGNKNARNLYGHRY